MFDSYKKKSVYAKINPFQVEISRLRKKVDIRKPVII